MSAASQVGPPVNRDQVSSRPELITEAGASAQWVSISNTKGSLAIAFYQHSCDQTGETVDQAWSKQRCNRRLPWKGAPLERPEKTCISLRTYTQKEVDSQGNLTTCLST